MKHNFSFPTSRALGSFGRHVALLLTLAGLASTAFGQSFGAKTDYTTGSSPYDVALGDINGDGRLDIVTANYNGNGVSVLLGLAAGGFGAKTDYTTGPGPLSIALGDVNGDGRLDIVTANLNAYNGTTASVLLGLAGGSFSPKTDYTTGPSPRGVALGDVNGDGRLDIVTANNGSGTTGNTASVLLGLAGGGFGPKTDYATGTGPVSVALGDVTGDGRLDLVTANFGSSSLSVLPGLATGGFGPTTDYTTALGPYDVALGDVNGDGRLDVATANYGRGGADGTTTSVLLGLAGGGFGPKTDYTTGRGPLTVTLGDVNGDGRLDLATANNGGDSGTTASVLLGLASGGFGAKTDYTTATAPRALVLGDVNGDGRLDIVTANSSNSASVLLNTGNFALAPALTTINPTSATVGTSVTLTGTNLSGATAVSFNGTAATTFAVVNSTSITATVPSGASSGNVTVTTPGGVSNGVAFTVVTAAPTLTSPANNGTTNGTPTFAGTAPAGSTVMLYLTPTSGATQLVATVTATGGTFSYTPTTALASGSYSTYATAQSSGATVSANSNTNTFTVDATAPTATISTMSGSPTSTAPIPFSVSFSEPVTGLSASSFTVSNGTVTSGPTSSGPNAYAFSVTPTGNGTVTVSLAANAVRDAVGNGNTASNSVSVQYTAPVASGLSVQYQTGDFGQPTDNQLRPFLQLVNSGSSAVPYSSLTVRYWLTPENFMGQLVTPIDYAKLGTAFVSARYVQLATPRQGAFGYIEYAFAAGAGNLAPGTNSGPIYGKAYKPDYSNFDETDDWSYQTSSSFTSNDHVTLYQNGTLIAGTEPPAVTSTTAVQVLSASRDASPSTQYVSLQLQVRNTGNVPFNYDQLRVRYYFSRDGATNVVPELDYAQLGSGSVNLRVVNLPAPVGGADAYLELLFTAGPGVFYPRSSTGDILVKLRKENYQAFDQTNDYSFSSATSLTLNDRITALVSNRLVFGTPPAGAPAIVAPASQETAARGSAEDAAATVRGPLELRLTASPNPVTDQVRLRFALPYTQAYTLAVYDGQGRLVQQLASGQADAGQAQELEVPTQTYAAGLYLVRLTTATDVQQFKFVKH